MFKKLIKIGLLPFIIYLGVGLYLKKDFAMILELNIMFIIGFYLAVDIIKHILFSSKVKVVVVENKEYSTFSTTGGVVFKYKFKNINNGKLYDSKYTTNQVINNNPFTAFVCNNKLITYRDIFLVLFLAIAFCSSTLYFLIKS